MPRRPARSTACRDRRRRRRNARGRLDVGERIARYGLDSNHGTQSESARCSHARHRHDAIGIRVARRLHERADVEGRVISGRMVVTAHAPGKRAAVEPANGDQPLGVVSVCHSVSPNEEGKG